MNTFQKNRTGDTIMYNDTNTGLRDGNNLLRCLRCAIEHSKQQSEGRVPPGGDLSSEYADA
jgi:hypothetical protein